MRETGKEFLSLIRKEEMWYVGHRVVVLNLWATLRCGKDPVSYVPHSFFILGEFYFISSKNFASLSSIVQQTDFLV